MKTSLARLASALLVLTLAAPAAEDVSPSLRVLNWNIRRCQGLDGKSDIERTAKVILEQKPDIVMLQEVDNRCRRSGSVPQAEALGRLTGMHHAFGKAMDHDGGGYGLALLSRTPLEDVKILPLPGEGEPRIVFMATTTTPLGKATVATLHLDHQQDARRLAQAQVAAEALLKSPHPVILAGDFNDRPGSPPLDVFSRAPWSLIAKSEPSGTFPADKPRAEIDFIVIRGFREKAPVRVIGEKEASDHRPLFVELASPE